MTSSGWVKIALMKPKEKSEKASVLGLVLAGGHNFALVRASDKSGLPKKWAQKPGPCMWQTAGISTDPIESASQEKLDTIMFRRAGKFTTPSRKKTDGDDLDLLRTCSTSGSSSKQCSFYDNEALDLLRSCSQQTLSEIGDKVHAETEKEDEKKLSKKEKIHLANRKRAVLGRLHACGATEFERRSQAMSFSKLTSFNSILKGETVIGLKQLLPKDDAKFKTPGHLRGKKKAMTTLLRLCTQHGMQKSDNKVIKRSLKKRIRADWFCPFCTCKIEFSDKASQLILQHLKKFHGTEKMKAAEKNLETGAVNGGSGRSALRHELGNNPLIQPLELRPIAKIDATFFCPYCLKGTKQVYDQKILLKTKRQHLKVCAKAPVGSTARQMDIDWKKSRSVAHKCEEKRLKVIKDLKKGKGMGVKKGHKPVVLPHSRNRNWPDFSTLICQHCLACSNDRNGGFLRQLQARWKHFSWHEVVGEIWQTQWFEQPLSAACDSRRG